jgi:hypothetical protein
MIEGNADPGAHRVDVAHVEVNEVHVWDRIAVAPDGSERAEPVPARRHR